MMAGTRTRFPLMIAVRSRLAECLRAEEVDAHRPVKLYQPPRDLFDHFLFRELSLHGPILLRGYRNSNSSGAIDGLSDKNLRYQQSLAG